MMGFFERLQNSLLWRVRLLVWGNRLRVGSKMVRRDPALISPYVAKLMALGRYEKPERDLLAYMQQHGIIRRGDRVVEAGGGLGTITMQIADIVGDDAVFVFEATPRTAQALRGNLALNGHSIAVEEAALIGDDRDAVEFSDTVDGVGFAVAGLHGRGPGTRTITVRAEPLTRAISRLDPTVLVLDVEGAEADILCSVGNWGRLRAIHIEIHPAVLPQARLDAMFEHLQQAGFRREVTPEVGPNLALLVRP
jgi:FkbM family methyltransferase